MIKCRMWVDTRREKANGLYPVKIEIRGKSKFYVSTGIDVELGDLQRDGYPKHAAKRAALRRMVSNVEIYCLNADGFSDAKIKRDISGIIGNKSASSDTLCTYIREYMTTAKIKPGTVTSYKQTLGKVSAFDGNVELEEIDHRWLEKFDRWMEDGGLATNSRWIHMKNISAVINWCARNEITTINPFRLFRLKREPTRHRALSASTIRQLYDYTPKRRSLYPASDIFMLSFFLIGMNLADIYELTPDNIIDGRIEYKRAKTGKFYSIKIEPEAQAIIDRYRGKKKLLSFCENKNLPILRARVNALLKRISILPDDVSYYYARHSWATIAYSMGIPDSVISDCLGHEHGSQITFTYIDVDTKRIDETNRRVIDWVMKEGG